MASTSEPPRGADAAAAADADAERRELDRGLRTALLAVEELRNDVLRLAAQVVAQGEALARLQAGGDPAAEAAHDAAIEARTDELATVIHARDRDNALHVELAAPVDKYAVEGATPPCLELLPICQARCCYLAFALTTQDLDEGVVRWDHGRPYVIRHTEAGHCVHLQPGGCDVYAHRPAPCRTYDCRGDRRVWLDYEARVPAPLEAIRSKATARELVERAQDRAAGLATELVSLRLRR